MAEIRVDSDSFILTSTWRVITGSNGVLYMTDGPTTDTRTVVFPYSLPKGAKVKSAQVHSSWTSPSTGFAVRTVNGIKPNDDNGWMVDVAIDPEQDSISVDFKMKVNGNTAYTGERSGSSNISEIYLVIVYERPGGVVRLAVDGQLVPYRLHHAENGVLVPYHIHHAENGELVPYGG